MVSLGLERLPLAVPARLLVQLQLPQDPARLVGRVNQERQHLGERGGNTGEREGKRGREMRWWEVGRRRGVRRGEVKRKQNNRKSGKRAKREAGGERGAKAGRKEKKKSLKE